MATVELDSLSIEEDQDSCYIEVPAYDICTCTSTCSTRKTTKRDGCPCKTERRLCSQHCKCGKPSKPCKNKLKLPTPFSQQDSRRQSEEAEKDKENADVAAFIKSLDEAMVRKLATQALQRGIGSMDFVQSLLVMEGEVSDGESSGSSHHNMNLPVALDSDSSEPSPPWCKCGRCNEMPSAIENRCYKYIKCVTTQRRFQKLYLDPEVLELCIKNRADIRNDSDNYCTNAFRKAAYRQFILDKHGRLGKGNRKVAPSCVVLAVRKVYPSPTGVYMSFKEH